MPCGAAEALKECLPASGPESRTGGDAFRRGKAPRKTSGRPKRKCGQNYARGRYVLGPLSHISTNCCMSWFSRLFSVFLSPIRKMTALWFSENLNWVP